MEPRFFTNNSQTTFLAKIRASLKRCTAFYFSVSFIKDAGLVLIAHDIEEALLRGAEGYVITSSYQIFTDLASLRKFYSWTKRFPSFHCHFDLTTFQDGGFHCKGYLFEYGTQQELIVGSSNITRFALCKNVEWDLSVSEKGMNSAYQAAKEEFFHLYALTPELDEAILQQYEKRLEYAIDRWDMDYISRYDENAVHPNLMQRAALKDIARYRAMGANKALVVAATGSGKTYLAAFDALSMDAKRLLFVVHRETILESALASFRQVFKERRTYGLYTGNRQEESNDFVFASVSELTRHLTHFDPYEFDYIVLDECHHATADSYQKILSYFHPSFLLGLTATPNRMDNQDVMALFDHNVPYQLTLSDAMQNDLVVGFRYYAVRDPHVDYSLDEIDPKEMVRQMVSAKNVDFIAKQLELHRPKNGKLKAIGFCRNVTHAMEMSQAMNDLGYHTTYLTGSDETGIRDKAITELSDESHPLEMIFTVDIFNEGIDIPAVNMVLFLRPTQSQTIFLQQLGRGLRKYPGKSYLTVLDFIGNSYLRSVQIALAFTSSLNPNLAIEKPLIRSLVANDFAGLHLPVEIHFDEKSKEEILSAIEKTNFNRADFLLNDYQKFKEYARITPYPNHMDYLNQECAPDLLRFINARMLGRKNGCYYRFLTIAEKDHVPHFSENEVTLLTFLSSFLPLPRADDFAILMALLSGDKTEAELKHFASSYEPFDSASFRHALLLLSGGFTFSEGPWNIQKHGDYYHFDTQSYSLEFIHHLEDLLEYGLERYRAEFDGNASRFLLYHPYSTMQVLLQLHARSNTYMKGTWIQGNYGVLFVGLKKDASRDERLQYKDKFLSPAVFQWESETGCTFDSTKGKRVLGLKKVSLFVRKVKEEDGITLPFLYVGDGVLTNPRLSSNVGQTLLFDVKLDRPVEIPYQADLLVPVEKKGHDA